MPSSIAPPWGLWLSMEQTEVSVATLTVSNPPGDQLLSIGTSWETVTVPTGVTAVYAQNLSSGAAVVANIDGAGGPEFPLATTVRELVWAGPRRDGNRQFHLKSDTPSTSVGCFMISDAGK